MSFEEKIKCFACQGTGFVGGNICLECNGKGFGIFYQNRLLYFGKLLTKQNIFLEKINSFLTKLLAFCLFVFSLFALGYFLFVHLNNFDILFSLNYWRSPDLPKLIFWFGCLSILYLIYFFVQIEKYPKKINYSLKIKETKLKTQAWHEALKQLKRSQILDVACYFSSEANSVIEKSLKIARKLNAYELQPSHLFLALLSLKKIQVFLSRLEISEKALKEKLKQIFVKENNKNWPVVSFVAKEIFLLAFIKAFEEKNSNVDALDLLFATLKMSKPLEEVLFDLGIRIEDLENNLKWFRIDAEISRRYKMFHRAVLRRPKGEMNRSMTALETRFLDRFSDDLTRLAGLGYSELCLDREHEMERILRVLESNKKGAILVGEHGVGKDAIFQGLAWKMIEEDVPKILKDKRLVSLSLPKLFAGATPQEIAQRLFYCLYDIFKARNVILVIPDIHEMTNVLGGGFDLSETLAKELEKGYLVVLGSTTFEDYEAIANSPLGHLLEKIEIFEPDFNQTIAILASKVGFIEYQEKVYFSYFALKKAVELSDKFLKEKFLPQKAIEVVQEAAQYVRQTRGIHQIVYGEDVAKIVSEKAKIPLTTLTQTETEKLLNLENLLRQQIIGQEEAVQVVAAALRRARAGLRDEKRPIANFLFLGPTGVGKTETAKALARIYFGGEEKMIRLDMSEFQEKNSLEKLIGAPHESGFFLEEIRQNPFSLVLLDEVEKAHPDILNVFLQIMDDGRATDGRGRVVDFTNTILIATSNAGANYLQESLKKGESFEKIKKALLDQELLKIFRPEFLNRFDAIIVFKPLSFDEVCQIAKLILGKIAKQLEAKGIFFQATQEAIEELATLGFDPTFGARPLRRVIQERVQDALANFLLTQKISRSDLVIFDKGGVFKVVPKTR